MKQGWTEKKLGDICTFKNGRAFKKTEWVQSGLPIIRIANLNNNNATFNFFNGEFDRSIYIEKGDLLFSWSGTVGSSFGPHIWDSNSGLLNQHIFKIGIKDDTSKYFLYNLLLWITSEVEKLTKGAVGLVHVNKSTLVDYQILIPKKEEQKKIVAYLDQTFAAIDTAKINVEKNLENAKELFQSKLDEIFSQKGEGWVEKKLGDVSFLMTGGTPSRKNKEYFENGEINWLVSGDINQKEIFECEGKITQLGLENSSTRYLPINSVMIALNGQGKTRGSVAMLKIKATCNQSLVSIYPNDITQLRPEYIYTALDSRYQEIRKITGDGGNDRRGLNMPLIRNINISFPTSTNEQEAIIQRIQLLRKKIQSLEFKYQQELGFLEELKKSILEKTFAGEL